MNAQIRFPLLLLFLISALLFPAPAQALFLQVRPGIYFDQQILIRSGEIVHGGFLLFGGHLTLEENAVLDGDVLAFGASLNLNGTVRGDVLIWGGELVTGEKVNIEGDVIVERTILYPSGKEIPFSPPSAIWKGLFAFSFSPLLNAFQILGQSLILGFFAFVLALFLERPLQNGAQALVSQPLIAGGLGLLTVLVIPLSALVLAITLIFIPLSFLLLILLALALLVGWVVLGLELGERLVDLLGRPWRFPSRVALGTFLLTLLALLLMQLPCVGWLPGALAAMLGLGAFLMSLLQSWQVR